MTFIDNLQDYLVAYFSYFTNIYNTTTDPKYSLTELLQNNDVYISCGFHALLYTILFSSIKTFFITGNFKSTDDFIFIRKLFLFLFILMILGYIGRLCRVKSIYDNSSTIEKMNFNTSRDIAYLRFYFFA